MGDGRVSLYSLGWGGEVRIKCDNSLAPVTVLLLDAAGAGWVDEGLWWTWVGASGWEVGWMRGGNSSTPMRQLGVGDRVRWYV